MSIVIVTFKVGILRHLLVLYQVTLNIIDAVPLFQNICPADIDSTVVGTKMLICDICK